MYRNWATFVREKFGFQVCLLQKFGGQRAKQSNHLGEMGPTTVRVEFRIMPGEKVGPLIEVPYLHSETSVSMCPQVAGQKTTNGRGISDLPCSQRSKCQSCMTKASQVWPLEHGRRSVGRLPHAAQCRGLQIRSRIVLSRSSQLLWHVELPWDVYGPSIDVLFFRGRRGELCLPKVGEDAVVPYPKHEVTRWDIYLKTEVSKMETQIVTRG